MSFISVLLAYCLSRFTGMCKVLHGDGWFAALVKMAAGARPAGSRAFLLVPVGLSLLLAVVWWQLAFWPAFFAGLLLLLFSVGRGDWRADLAALPGRIADGKAESVWLALQEDGSADTSVADGDDSFWTAICRHVAAVYLDRLFAVFLWFFLLGPAGAVFYRLVSLYNTLPAVRAGQLQAQRGWLDALAWLPARYMGLCACLAGNFATAFHVWRGLLLDTRLAPDRYLARCLEAALVSENGAAVDCAETDPALQLTLQRHPALQDLLVRTEIIGLVGLALAILLLH